MPDLHRMDGPIEFLRVGYLAKGLDIPLLSRPYPEVNLASSAELASASLLDHTSWFAPIYREMIQCDDLCRTRCSVLIRTLCAVVLLSCPGVARAADVLPAPGSLRMPVASGCLSSPFGPRRAIGPHAPAAFHTGVDLPAPAGGKVFAVAAGQVIGIHKRGAGGLEVVMRHNGYTAIYAHLGRVTPALAEGHGKLSAGEEIGVVGRTGVTYGTHLFLEILVDGQPTDPAPLLGARPCRAN